MNKKMRLSASLLLAAITAIPVMAGDVHVTVSEDKQPVTNAVVYLKPAKGEAPPVSDPVGIMDQRNAQFVPHVLVVHKDALVQFPNSDNIRHHVYSFSPAKQFQLRLYSGTEAEPVLFGKTGPVVLGCNIHDWMLGYIYVVDTPWFAKTGESGELEFRDIPAGDYQLFVWHPRLPDINTPISQPVTVTYQQVNETITVALKPAMTQKRTAPEERRRSLRENRRGRE